MKKVLLCLLLSAFMLVGCDSKEVVQEQEIEVCVDTPIIEIVEPEKVQSKACEELTQTESYAEYKQTEAVFKLLDNSDGIEYIEFLIPYKDEYTGLDRLGVVEERNQYSKSLYKSEYTDLECLQKCLLTQYMKSDMYVPIKQLSGNEHFSAICFDEWEWTSELDSKLSSFLTTNLLNIYRFTEVPELSFNAHNMSYKELPFICYALEKDLSFYDSNLTWTVVTYVWIRVTDNCSYIIHQPFEQQIWTPTVTVGYLEDMSESYFTMEGWKHLLIDVLQYDVSKHLWDLNEIYNNAEYCKSLFDKSLYYVEQEDITNN